MKQPELGRKITEFRKGRGLTQEELVNKCNISVRTLQRIEAARERGMKGDPFPSLTHHISEETWLSAEHLPGQGKFSMN